MSFQLGMVLIASITDQAWGTAGYTGLQKAGKLPGVETAFIDRVPASQWEDSIHEFAHRGFHLVLGHGGELSRSMKTVAARFPQTMFACLNGEHLGHNLASLAMDDEQLGYLVGALAAMASRSGVVGYVGGLKILSTSRQSFGFEQGARDHGATVISMFTGDFSNQTQAAEATLGLADQRVDVVYYYLNQAASGVLRACRQRGLFAISAVTDQRWLAPDILLTSALQDVGTLYRMATRHALRGELEGKRYVVGMENPTAQGLAPLHHVSRTIADKVDLVRSKIIAGEIEIQRLENRVDDSSSPVGSTERK